MGSAVVVATDRRNNALVVEVLVDPDVPEYRAELSTAISRLIGETSGSDVTSIRFLGFRSVEWIEEPTGSFKRKDGSPIFRAFLDFRQR